MVDDDGDSCELVATMFSLCGADITTCSSVEEALERLAVLQPQLLLSDIAMPLQDGYVQDLHQETAHGISVSVKRCQPTDLTIFDEAGERD